MNEILKTHDIIIDIPDNTIEFTIVAKIYENEEIVEAENTFNLEAIKEAERTFEKCCNGEYPQYQVTEKGKLWLEELGINE